MMKLLFLLFSVLLFNTDSGWLTNFDEAKKIAAEKNEYILLNFSGSDWCGPCIRMKTEIFESTAFKNYSEAHLVLLNADFPRYKKNKLSSEQLLHNEKLADKYDPLGKFPYTVLLNAKGDIVKEWDGLAGLKANEFVKQIMLISENAK
ncbi:MAG: thioredoxin family protein [Ferruginibacter sp.]